MDVQKDEKEWLRRLNGNKSPKKEDSSTESENN